MNESTSETSEIEDLDVEDLMSQMLEDAVSVPNYVISGSGWGWFLDPEVHQFIRCSRGTEIIPMDELPDEADRILVRSPYRFLLIPKNEVQEIGWN
jgi:hypothetical protein